jgi:hypothetical protein
MSPFMEAPQFPGNTTLTYDLKAVAGTITSLEGVMDNPDAAACCL